ncbi:MAG TPA: bacteriohemerythrin [Leptospiraceae bacterium]|nr:bacteriohemerythrin [Leptospiraceae bacterium]HMX32810.1 bacteriohemerythrin [Leptospiraceae bacterium]HMY33539.1 bacteriohemerythrin [Leptospiraceae bacterium]HMZ66799.1 bacteriohemerythrin [Leptospiraceae bacterium]HNA09628.1 bacteriohemerythrin [Leptospiraceae bacterium]
MNIKKIIKTIRESKIQVRLLITYIFFLLVLMSFPIFLFYNNYQSKSLSQNQLQLIEDHMKNLEQYEKDLNLNLQYEKSLKIKSEEIQRETNGHLNKNLFYILIFTIIIIIGSFITVMVILKDFIKPLKEAISAAERLSSNDMNFEVNDRFMDEMGSLLHHIKIVRVMIRSIFSQISEIANRISEAAQTMNEYAEDFQTSSENLKSTINESELRSSELNQSTVDIVEVIHNQNTSLQKFKNDILNLNILIQSIEKEVREISKLSSVTKQEASGSKNKIFELKSAMEDIQRNSESIQDITSLINDISEQINLLALNASIEAARAGAAGLGFRVVANEVSKLAENTASRVKEIGTLIKTTNKAIIRGIDVVNDAGLMMDNLMQSSEKVDELITRTTGAIEQQSFKSNEAKLYIEAMALNSMQIENMIDEQKQKIHEMHIKIGSINSDSELIAEGANKMNALAKDKVRTAKFLKQISGEFKIDNKYLLQWDSSFETGVNSIDSQHKELLNILNNLFTSVHMNHSTDKLAEILLGLVDYTVYHFNHEEELMRDCDYPQFAKHKEEHENLKKAVLAFKKDFEAGTATISFELLDFLRRWLINHILYSDKKLGEFYTQK